MCVTGLNWSRRPCETGLTSFPAVTLRRCELKIVNAMSDACIYFSFHCSPCHIVWFSCRMIHGWALFVSQRRTGRSPSRSGERSLALRGATQRKESNAPPLWPGYGLWNPGKPGQVLCCITLSLTAIVEVCDALLGVFAQSLLSEHFPDHPSQDKMAQLRQEQDTTEVGPRVTDERWYLLPIGYLDFWPRRWKIE